MTDDPRLNTIIEPFDPKNKYHIVIIGFPYDEGCRRNGGRVGAAKGPQEIRKVLYKMGTIYNPELDVDMSKLRIGDLGDVSDGLQLETAHMLLTSKVTKAIKNGAVPIIIGGSNDQSYQNADGYLGSKSDLSLVINVDAHLDVRPFKDHKAHSGSPFRQLLDDKRFKGLFVEFAAQGNQCSLEHTNFVLERGHKIDWLSRIKKNPERRIETYLMNCSGKAFLSFDIDSIRASDCPGVSCPGTRGLTADDALNICFVAGLSKKIGIFDISEFNPLMENSITPRLVANMIIYFLLGFCTQNTDPEQKPFLVLD